MGGDHARRSGRAPAGGDLGALQGSLACADCWSVSNPAPNEMLKRIRKDITIEQVFHTAQKMRDYGIAGIFPFIVGFPERKRRERRGDARRRQAAARR